ncbi:MAG: enoyl-CoA hydratase-related protein [Acidimicrobiales bacterium]
MIELERHDDVFVLTMTAGENRWNTTFNRAFAAAIDEVESSEGAAALVTASSHEKFFSNGLDLEWMMGRGEHPGGDRKVFAVEFMALMARIITLPMPTVAAIGGHGFGAGIMLAVAHDVRIMREDRGYLCANELEVGITIPEPEIALFRHKLSASTFHQTVMLATRWTGPAAVAAGLVEAAVPADRVLAAATERAASLAHLATNRAAYGWQKRALYGENSVLNGPHGAAHLLASAARYISTDRP